DDQIIPRNTSLKTNAFNTKATKAKQWKLFQENLDKEIELQEDLHNITHMSVERLWNITWKKANPKKIPTHKQTKYHSQPHNINRNIGSVYNLGKIVHLANIYIKRKRKSNTVVKKINKMTKFLQKQNIPITNLPFQKSTNQKTRWLEEVKDLWQATKKITSQELQSNINTQIKEASQKKEWTNTQIQKENN
ncbi:9205_t:CDS:1, partial [Acaulospora morrowiae]